MKKTAILLVGLFTLLLGLEWRIRQRAAASPGAWATRPLPAADPAATRIVVLGDSIAYGDGLPAAQTWPAQLEERLRKGYPHRRWQVINAGVSGSTTADAYVRYDLHVRAWRPHVVIIALGLNDCRVVPRPLDARRVAAFHRNEIPLLGHSYLFRGVLNRIVPLPPGRDANERAPESPRIPYRDFSSLLDWFVRSDRSLHAQTVFLTLAPLGPQLAAERAREFAHWSEYNEVIRAQAQAHGLPLIDISAPFPAADFWMPDGVHLSARGEAEIAERVYAALPIISEY